VVIVPFNLKEYDSMATLPESGTGGKSLMLFNWKIPMSHRATIFVAANFTCSALLKLLHGTPISSAVLIAIALFGMGAVYQWHQRHTWQWRLEHPDGSGDGLLDLLQNRFDTLPVWVRLSYWMAIIFGAVLIYWLVPARA
jgi:hypothetical protein